MPKTIKPTMKYGVKFKRIVNDKELGIQIKLSHQGELAEYLKISRQFVNGIMTGKYTISEERYNQIKNYFIKNQL